MIPREAERMMPEMAKVVEVGDLWSVREPKHRLDGNKDGKLCYEKWR